MIERAGPIVLDENAPDNGIGTEPLDAMVARLVSAQMEKASAGLSNEDKMALVEECANKLGEAGMIGSMICFWAPNGADFTSRFFGPAPGMSEGQFELAAQELGAIANRLRTHRINQQIQPATE
jgi:hypothetical protein